jgi:type I restriction enzyme S subunit
MSSEMSLSSICEIVMGQSPSGDACNESGVGLPLLNGPTEFGDRNPTPVQYTTDPKKIALPYDLLFCVRGSTTGRMNWADQRYAIGRGLAAIRGKDGYPTSFVRALIETKLGELLQSATGSTFPNVGKDMLAGLKIPNILSTTASEISSIVEPIDDRITLLRETNKTLEAIAQAIFKSWFIDFDPVRAKMEGRAPAGLDEETAALFPDELVVSELGLVPKGWEVKTVGENFVLTMGQSPPGDTYNEVGNGMPFYQGRTDFGFRFPSQRIFCSAPTRIAEDGDTLVSVRAPVGDVNMAIERCCLGRGVASVRHPKNYRGFTFYSMRNLGTKFKTFDGEGTVFGSINKKDFASLPVISPSDDVLAKYDDLTESIDQKIVLNELMIRTLIEVRDGLLPRLISGKLRVDTAAVEAL